MTFIRAELQALAGGEAADDRDPADGEEPAAITVDIPGGVALSRVTKRGRPPFNVAVVHGGPGAAGEMAPVAEELASGCGVLEPIQTAASLNGQVCELRAALETAGDPPLTLIGFSWGAWLGFILAARYPELVHKLILVGSGPFEDEYVPQVHQTRLQRLNPAERVEFDALIEGLADRRGADGNELLQRLAALTLKCDAYDPLPGAADLAAGATLDAEIFHNVWTEAAELRRTGELLEHAGRIRCPVVAVHGDHDPHPADGVRLPLSSRLDAFRFVLLEKCGHKPWIERHARDAFYRILRAAVRDPHARRVNP